jgi:DNA-binding response OmpR family regulator
MNPHILLVEDDATIGRSLTGALENEGYHVTWVPSGAGARTVLQVATPDLVLLDLGLPDMDGADLCRELTALEPSLRVLVLTARHDPADVVVSLDAGAIDYVKKPFRLAELFARVRAHLRQAQGSEDERVTVGSLQLDHSARRLWLGSRELLLTPREFDLLSLLAQNAGEAVRREHIMDEVWEPNWNGSTKTLDVHISAIRRKFAQADIPGTPTIIALPRVGYRLDAP